MFFVRRFLAKYLKKNRGSPCSFKRKGQFIPLSSVVRGKSLMFCTCTRSCARADDAKIVRRGMRNAILRNYLKPNVTFKKYNSQKRISCNFNCLFSINPLVQNNFHGRELSIRVLIFRRRAVWADGVSPRNR